MYTILIIGLGLFGPSGVEAQDELTEEELEGLSEEDRAALEAMTERPAPRTGTGIAGRVVADDSDEAIIEGQVVVVDRTARGLTNLDGYYAIDLPPGEYSVRSFYELYQPATVTQVVVVEGEVTEVNIRLMPDATAAEEEFVVEARADTGGHAVQQQVRRQAAVVRDSISAEEISRSPDSAASDAARRVVAASIVDGQYLYVRGLGGRYTNVLLEGAPLPNLDPLTPGVQLDLFPAGVLSSVSIVKTYTPELPGSFAGGTMLLETREFPEELEVEISLSLGFNTATTFQDGLYYQGGALDFLGFDDGTRALPESAEGVRLDTGDDLTRDELVAIGRDFPVHFGIDDAINLPPIKLGFSVGDRIDLDEDGDRYLGYLFSASYSRNIEQETGEITRDITDANESNPYVEDLRRNRTSVETRLAALGSVTWEFMPRHDLSLLTLFNQSSDDFASIAPGADEGFYGDPMYARLIRRRQQFVARTIWFNQLSGDHRDVFGSSRLRWRLNASYGARNEPDTRELRYAWPQGAERPVWQGRNPSEGQRVYTDFEQLSLGGGADYEVPLGPLTLTTGGAFNLTERSFLARRFRYQAERGALEAARTAQPDELFAPANSGSVWLLREVTNPTDSYEASESTYAGYAMAELPLFDERLRIIGGVRAEGFRQVLLPSARFAIDGQLQEDDQTRRTDVDLLPAANVVVELTDEMAVRAGYSATVARPQIRELAQSIVFDYTNERSFYGTPDLRRSLIHNFDLRWEYFPSSRDVIAISAFGKLFEDPIEIVVVNANDLYSFRNIESATNVGFEYEVKLGLGHFTELLEDFSVGANWTLVLSEATLGEELSMAASSAERPLVGQSPFTVNASIGWENEELGLDVNLLYNVFGRRLYAAGANYVSDVYEEPVHSLDLVLGYEISDEWKIKGALRNLLFQTRRWTQAEYVQRESSTGLSGSIQLSWTP
jgi:outer membrane receptor protein involved in Fe transport